MWRPACICIVVLWLLPRYQAAATVGLIRIEGPIGPARADYIERAISVAEEQQFEALLIQLDTPGGLLDSTKEIVQAFLGTRVPIVVYVAPPGARAASAGTFITLAAHVAAMAPTTTIGAAHPVAVGGGNGAGGTNGAMGAKLENYAASFIESIAARRERNVDWAIQAVRESASITAEQALELNVVDFVAPDQTALLREMDGREVGGRVLRTAGTQVREIPMVLRERFLNLFWRPEVMMILLLIAVYGILGELGNPGSVLPGAVGVIALILALYMMAVLPVNVAGLLLIALAISLFIVEIFTPTFGLWTAGGLIAFVLGALMLFDTPGSVFRLSLKFVLPAALVTAAFFLLVVGAGLRAQFQPVRVGKETLVGKITIADTPIGPQPGHVKVEGELWRAVSDVPVDAGQAVEIIGSEGLTLKVRPKTK